MKGFTILLVAALVTAAIALPTPNSKEHEVGSIRKLRNIDFGFGISDIGNYGDYPNYGNYGGYYGPYRPYGRPHYPIYNGGYVRPYGGIGGSIGFGVGTNFGIGYGGYGGDYWD